MTSERYRTKVRGRQARRMAFYAHQRAMKKQRKDFLRKVRDTKPTPQFIANCISLSAALERATSAAFLDRYRINGSQSHERS